MGAASLSKVARVSISTATIIAGKRGEVGARGGVLRSFAATESVGCGQVIAVYLITGSGQFDLRATTEFLR